jgi:hypothetical protein
MEPNRHRRMHEALLPGSRRAPGAQDNRPALDALHHDLSAGAQASCCQRLADQSSAPHVPLHAHFGELDESDGDRFSIVHRKAIRCGVFRSVTRRPTWYCSAPASSLACELCDCGFCGDGLAWLRQILSTRRRRASAGATRLVDQRDQISGVSAALEFKTAAASIMKKNS